MFRHVFTMQFISSIAHAICGCIVVILMNIIEIHRIIACCRVLRLNQYQRSETWVLPSKINNKGCYAYTSRAWTGNDPAGYRLYG